MAYDPRTHASEHFAWTEFACHSYFHDPYPYDWRVDRGVPLARELEAIRALLSSRLGRDCPLRLNSVFRTEAWNRACGGKKFSQHLEGRAADVMCPFGCTFRDFHDTVIAAAHTPGSRIRYLKIYPHQGFIHLDIRPTDALVTEYDDTGDQA